MGVTCSTPDAISCDDPMIQLQRDAEQQYRISMITDACASSILLSENKPVTFAIYYDKPYDRDELYADAKFMRELAIYRTEHMNGGYLWTTEIMQYADDTEHSDDQVDDMPPRTINIKVCRSIRFICDDTFVISRNHEYSTLLLSYGVDPTSIIV